MTLLSDCYAFDSCIACYENLRVYTPDLGYTYSATHGTNLFPGSSAPIPHNCALSRTQFAFSTDTQGMFLSVPKH